MHLLLFLTLGTYDPDGVLKYYYYHHHHFYHYHYHRLRGSASPVLTATGFVNGKGQFLTPYRINTP